MANVGYATLQVIPSVRGISDDIRRQLVGPAGDAGRRAGDAAGEGFGDKLKAGIAGAAVAAGALLVKGLNDAIDQANITSTLQAQLGTSNAVAAKQGRLAGKLYSSGVADTFEGAAEAIKSVVQSGLAPPNATNRQLQSIATKASDVANVFGQELGGVTNAVSQLMRTGLVKNSSEAFDLLTKGFESGANKADDLLDTVNEYGTQFRKAGLTGSDAVGLINQAIRGGARDADLAADAIKEFSIRAADGSQTTKDGFKALGLSADDMAAKFGKGGSTAKAALDLTLDRLRGIKDPVQQGAAAVNLFGTQAEDLGAALFKMDPSAAAQDLGKLGGSAQKLGDTIRSGPLYEISVFARTLKQGFVEFLGGQVLPILTEVGQFLNANVLPSLKTVVSVVGSALVPALATLISVGGGVIGFLREYGVWLAPLGIAIVGVTIALNVQAISVALVTAVFSAYRIAILAGTAVTNGFGVAQALLNNIMALNPITLVVIALVALAAALVIAWNKAETFRNVVMAMWDGIKTAALFVWNTALKPVFAALVAVFRQVGQVASWLWNNVISPVFSFIALAAKILFTAVVVIVLLPLVAAFKLVSVVVLALWHYAFQPMAAGIAAVFGWLWNTILRPLIALAVFQFQVFGAVVRWLYNNVVKPVFTLIASTISVWWMGTKATFNAVVGFLRRTLGPVFTWLYNNVIKPVWNGIKATISEVWNTGIKPVFNALKSALGLVGAAFGKARDAIKVAWDKVRSIAKAPVSFIVNTVYNRGIVGVWNKVAAAFGAPKLSTFKFATGGVLPGYTPGRDVHLAALSGGEAVMRPEWTRAVGPGYVNTMNAAARHGGVTGVQRALGLPGFADGGIFGWVGRTLQGAGSSAWDAIKKSAGWLKNTLEASARAGVQHVVNPLLKHIPGLDTEYGKAIRGIPNRIVDAIFGYSKEADRRGAAGVGGPAIQRALSWARAQAGKPYVWGGVGPKGFDCSGFMGAIQSMIQGKNPYRRLWSTFSFQGSRAPSGWKQHAKSGFMIGVTNAGVGHTAGTLGGVNIESRGGNGVLVGNRARGYNSGLFTDWYGFTPAKGTHDSGGWLMPGQVGINGLRQPEAVLNPQQWRIAEAAVMGGDEPLVVEIHTRDAALANFIDVRVWRAQQELVANIRAK